MEVIEEEEVTEEVGVGVGSEGELEEVGEEEVVVGEEVEEGPPTL